MQNAVTHAEANRIVIDLEQAHDRPILGVEDDGQEMSDRSPSDREIGRDIISSRAQALGGHGTAVSGPVPLGITA